MHSEDLIVILINSYVHGSYIVICDTIKSNEVSHKINEMSFIYKFNR